MTHCADRLRGRRRASASGPAAAIDRVRPAVVDGQHEPAGRGHPVRDPRDERLGDALRIEAGIHRPNHLGEDVGARQLAPERRLQRPEPRRRGPYGAPARRLSCSMRRRARGCRPSPVNRLCVPCGMANPSKSFYPPKIYHSRSESGLPDRGSAPNGSGSAWCRQVRGIIDVSSFHRIDDPVRRQCIDPSPQEAAEHMTMLDRMRRHKNWLKWSLALVVLAFVLLYIPSFLRNRRRQRQSTTSSRRSKAARSRSASSAASTSSRCRRTARRTAATSTSSC